MLLSNISSEKFSDTVLGGVSTPAGKLQSSNARTGIQPREDCSRTEGLFVIIVTVCRNQKHNDLRIVDSIDKAVLL